ncbi:apolipoprotein N-acyltransferase [Rhodobacterales bacterium HKCCE3408]|nr:apolipoprotein N-acyltransferase [Rhodobacterales bacterium HKCCE3408]
MTPVRRAPLWALLAGAAAATGQAPFDLWFVAIPAFAAGLWLIAGATRPGLTAWCFGLGHFALALHWIVEPFLVEPEIFGWLAPFGLIGMAGGMALFWLAAGLIAKRVAALRNPVGIAVLLALAELVRAYALSGFPWAEPGHILIETPALALAPWIGPHGLTLLVLLAAAALAELAPRRRVAAATLAAAIALPLALLPQPVGPLAGSGAPLVRLVQANAPQHLKWRPDMVPVFFQRGLDLTAEGEPVDLVIWPETSLPALLDDSRRARTAIAGVSDGAPAIVGAQRIGPDGPRNTLALLDPQGDVMEIYDKHRLVPFGEYMPMRGLAAEAGINGLAAQLAGGYWPGDGPHLLDLGDRLGRAFPMICYEAIFPQYLRRTERPDWMVHITNDAWFGTLAGPYQHLALARLRAAEAGLPILRAANTGVSAVIDARGHVVASLPLDTAGALDARIPPALPPTLYARTGDAPALAAVLLLIVLVPLAYRRRNSH